MIFVSAVISANVLSFEFSRSLISVKDQEMYTFKLLFLLSYATKFIFFHIFSFI